jgi:hypothetical protein
MKHNKNIDSFPKAFIAKRGHLKIDQVEIKPNKKALKIVIERTIKNIGCFDKSSNQKHGQMNSKQLL